MTRSRGTEPWTGVIGGPSPWTASSRKNSPPALHARGARKVDLRTCGSARKKNVAKRKKQLPEKRDIDTISARYSAFGITSEQVVKYECEYIVCIYFFLTECHVWIANESYCVASPRKWEQNT